MSKQPEAIPPEMQEKLKDLTPEQADMFVRALSLAMRKRRMMLIGYLLALLFVIGGTVVSLIVWADHEKGTFIGWIFLMPAMLAGGTLFLFGKLTKRIGR